MGKASTINYFEQLVRNVRWAFPDLDATAARHAANILDEEVLEICYDRQFYSELPLNLNPYYKITWEDCQRIAAYLIDNDFFGREALA